MISMLVESGARSPDGIPLHPLSLTRLGLDESWGFNSALNQLFYDVLVLYIGPSVTIERVNPKQESTFFFSFSKHLLTNSNSTIFKWVHLQFQLSVIEYDLNWVILSGWFQLFQLVSAFFKTFHFPNSLPHSTGPSLTFPFRTQNSSFHFHFSWKHCRWFSSHNSLRGITQYPSIHPIYYFKVHKVIYIYLIFPWCS